jgi:hypothetical protein
MLGNTRTCESLLDYAREQANDKAEVTANQQDAKSLLASFPAWL